MGCAQGPEGPGKNVAQERQFIRMKARPTHFDSERVDAAAAVMTPKNAPRPMDRASALRVPYRIHHSEAGKPDPGHLHPGDAYFYPLPRCSNVHMISLKQIVSSCSGNNLRRHPAAVPSIGRPPGHFSSSRRKQQPARTPALTEAHTVRVAAVKAAAIPAHASQPAITPNSPLS
jgi:hypothetical protein